MSASKQKKTRAQKREEGVEKRLVKKKEASLAAKKEKRSIAIVCTVLAIVVLLLVALNSPILYNNFTAVTIGDVSFTASEYSFFYNSSYMNYINYYNSMGMLDYIGIDRGRPLDSQSYPYGEDMTWADYFKGEALTSMESVAMLWTEANAAGFTLDEDQQAELDETLEGFKTIHEGSDYPTANSYIATVYGKGLNVARISELVTMSYIADAYEAAKAESFTYTDDEIEAHYVEKKDDFDNFTYLTYLVSGAADEENGIDAETAMAKAKETADAIIADVKTNSDVNTDTETDADSETDTGLESDADAEAVYDETTFMQRVLDLTATDATAETKQGSSLSGSYSEDFVNWVRDSSRKYGDRTVIETESGCYALFFMSREDNNYETRKVRHVLINVVADEEGTYTDEAKAEALTRAEELLAGWKDGEATEDSFAELANAYSDDTGSNTNGGFYENIYKGQMVPEFNEWTFDPARKVGDTGIVFNEGSYCGYHIVYFVGYGETYRSLLSESDMRNTDYSDWKTVQLESFKSVKGFTAFLVK